jgi:gamma-glutamyltranspeptidase/glutathione hydrolase
MAFTTRPVILGTRGVVTSGHYLATQAGLRILQQGGNAIDSAAAMCIALNLLEPQNNGIGGEAPTLIYSAAERKAFAISGQGWSPQALTVEWCKANSIDLIPGDGYLPACVPATLDTWALALARFGTLSFAQVLQPVIELAEDGFPIYEGLHVHLKNNTTKYTELYPSTGEIYLPSGAAPQTGDVWRNPDFAAMLKHLVQAEANAKGQGRVKGIEAARNAFYEGEIAAKIVEFIAANPVKDAASATSGKQHAGLLTRADFAEWHAELDEPTMLNYGGHEVLKCGPWTQGPVFLQQLALLRGFDLRAMGHNSAEYLHTLMEVAKLAFADREAYYGDPNFDAVPLDVLLSEDYNANRRALIAQDASDAMRPGDVGRGVPEYAARFDVAADNRAGMEMGDLGVVQRPYAIKHTHLGDTTHCDAIDRAGNMVACTPSGGWIGTSPVIRGLGFPLGTRGQMYYLNPNRPNALQPHKRPRATLTPTLVLRNGAPHMAFGTPGGDGQDQWTLQLFLNMAEFGMTIQEALDAPTAHSLHFPSSFYPRSAFPNKLEVENRIPSYIIDELRDRGHDVDLIDGWQNGKCMGILFDGARGVIQGGASPRHQIGYAMGW